MSTPSGPTDVASTSRHPKVTQLDIIACTTLVITPMITEDASVTTTNNVTVNSLVSQSL